MSVPGIIYNALGAKLLTDCMTFLIYNEISLERCSIYRILFKESRQL